MDITNLSPAEDKHPVSEWIFPDFMNNLALPEGERAGMLIARLTHHEVALIEKKIRLKDRKEKRTKKRSVDLVGKVLEQQDAKRLATVRAGVKAIKNWSVTDKETKAKREIVSFDELLAILSKVPGLYQEVESLLNELFEEIALWTDLDEDDAGE